MREPKDLHRFVIGQNEGWMDVAICRAAGISTKEVRSWSTGSSRSRWRPGSSIYFPGLKKPDLLPAPFSQELPSAHDRRAYSRTLRPWFRFVRFLLPMPMNSMMLSCGADAIARDGTFMSIWLRCVPNRT